MSNLASVPDYLVSKTGEEISPRFLTWVQNNQKKLLKSFPEGEKAFCRIIDKMKSRLPDWSRRFHYVRQKWFIVSPNIVFFGDFYFRELKLLVELDGAHHNSEGNREKDEWRTKMISLWKVKVVRLSNDTVTNQDFRGVEEWFIKKASSMCRKAVARRLCKDYLSMKTSFSHIYNREGTLTTYRPT